MYYVSLANLYSRNVEEDPSKNHFIYLVQPIDSLFSGLTTQMARSLIILVLFDFIFQGIFGRDPQIGCSFWNSLAENDLLDMLLGEHPEKISIL